MKSKKLATIISIILIGMILIALDMYKSYKEEKPPTPLISVGNETIPVILGPYQWNVDMMNEQERNELLKDIDNHPVHPLEELHIQFPEEKKPTNIEVFYSDRYIRNEIYDSNYFTEHELKVNIPNEQRPLVLTIKADWDGKKRAEYYIPIQTMEVFSFQELLPEEDDMYSLLYYNSRENEDPFYSIPFQLGILPLFNILGYEDKNFIETMYPELKINGTEKYWLFDRKGMVLETSSFDDLLQFFLDKFEPSTTQFIDTVTSVNKEEKTFTMRTIQFYYEEIEQLEVGQTIRIQTTFHDFTDLKKTTIHRLDILEEQPLELQDSQWFSKNPGKFTVLTFAHEDYFKYHFDDSEIEDLVENIYKKTISDREYHPLQSQIIIFDEHGPVYIAYNIKEVIYYLKNVITTN